MADNEINVNALPVKTAPAAGDKMLMIGAAEEYQIDYDKLASAILDKLATKQYSELDTTAKTVLGALDELNGKTKSLRNCTIRDFTVTDGKITMTISLQDFLRSTGLYILSLNASNQQIASIVFNYAYESTVIARTVANLYDNLDVNIKRNDDITGIVVEITADQIKSTQVYNYGCVKICPTYY